MSLLIRLEKLSKDLTLTDEEKYNVFEELLHSFLVKSKFNDFKILLNYYQYKQDTLYECVTRCIEQDRITFVKHLTHNYNENKKQDEVYNVVPVRLEDIKYSISRTKTEILKYLLTQCSRDIVTNDVIFESNDKGILRVLVRYGVDPEPKLDIIVQKCIMMNKMGQSIDNWCNRGDMYSITFFISYLENYINLCCSTRHEDDQSVKHLSIIKESLEKIVKKEYSYKTAVLQNFYRFLEQNNADDIARVNMILMSI
jgi:hypothetical protein